MVDDLSRQADITVMTTHVRNGVSNRRQLYFMFNSFQGNKEENMKARHHWPFVKGIHR